MPPAKDATSQLAGTNEPFRKAASTVIVTFEVAADARDPGREDDDEYDNREIHRQKLRMSFKACYEPPIVTLRFNVGIFGYGEDTKKEKTTLYFDVPRHHISSLESTHHVDVATVPELSQDDIAKLAGGITRLRFHLTRPGNLIQPSRELSLKPASQHTLASMTLLAKTLDFVLLMPHTTLSKQQLQCLQQAVTSPITFHDQLQQDKEHDFWLAALYGGAGGRLLNTRATAASPPPNKIDDVSTASESGDSTVATATPPAYRRSAAPSDHGVDAVGETNGLITASDFADEITAAGPPPYDSLASGDKTSAPAADMTKKQVRKRLQDSVKFDTRNSRRRLGSEPLFAGGKHLHAGDIARTSTLEDGKEAGIYLPYPSALILEKLDEVLRRAQYLEKENGLLKAEISAMREGQDQMKAELKEMADRDYDRSKKTKDLENEHANLEDHITHLRQCHDDIEERQAELEDRQGRIEEKCDNIELEIVDQVHTALRERLISALETI
ncbi:hypothetical protein JX265_005604 [Neoarthrinium moseri]|uniref:Uncharacterized protein n=1 Tax=Neoarthrinium moseri TaxID=1658444 RepID=A0A9P9WNC6_9PEZI|nr:hypothetical protein JX266_011650 [Neoarthrinium moseri]KAI1871618.1 hypothetical protein JX265_005604 [Neoarthrinium moseri]